MRGDVTVTEHAHTSQLFWYPKPLTGSLSFTLHRGGSITVHKRRISLHNSVNSAGVHRNWTLVCFATYISGEWTWPLFLKYVHVLKSWALCAEKPGVIRCKFGERASVCLMMKSVLSLISLVITALYRRCSKSVSYSVQNYCQQNYMFGFSCSTVQLVEKVDS